MKFSKFNLIVDNGDGKYILFNTFTGHSFFIDENLKLKIEKDEISNLEQKIYDDFLKYKVIIDDNIDENRYFTYYHNKQKFSDKVISSTILLTWACNLKCVYCYEGAGEIRSTMLSKEMAQNYIEFMKNECLSRNSNIMSVNLFGGEPLINFELADYICTELKRFCDENNKQFITSIVTNGTLLTDNILEKLRSFNCSTIQITLDGTKEIHDSRRMYKDGRGSFDKTISSIKLINSKENYIKPVIRINVDKTNIKEAYKLLEYLQNEGLSSCRLDFGIVRGSTDACSSYSDNCFVEEELGDLLEELWNAAEKCGFKKNVRPFRRWMYCGLYSDSSFTVAPNGDVYKCWEQVGEEIHKIGELSDKGTLKNIQYAYFDWMTRNPVDTVECRNCVYLPACGGGCGVISFAETGSYHAKGCFKTKGVLEKSIKSYIESKINLKENGNV
ncbi:Cys-every-fifth radical SAM/SPASM peptide maturase CefB [Thomasclavelia spiroformis]|uniref:Cys-every-fifth radical SAM/SPASM peptide maturase CefB n=1 Tax=Thomasclavelia spiroformis TaxID=29348 RepID=UPI00241D0E60|nr:Cys-every-fifth radical SAM/SPASM peptide maturase CefB [Thomasclavelia spiroformis]MBS6114277.1 Cys-every-fifth radical SAM/SPASM peptide maturase CefB [Thomasclavelia spiroformis]